ncbi:MAG: cytochrome c biogenesis heme-transporting ATPase CcmA [Gammaproteobacteria bacterium]|jgi:heme exporter protein A|nr:cytochrome c biogenesis heme-transporting ATPase CcmA [Gammaproteobacteria bacterium]MDP6616549.1 cytochrome c biogenesis heme-transporting ATPase CcmA [Gammaproteobacteria bacterium]MDP6694202.1 cytochrome c biogenesis heme-transporting ATPase CcmA [Gammaproteobacteria bacterium]
MDTASYRLEWRELALWRGDRCLQQSLTGRLEAGQALTVRGPNGCGKTTLLRTLCGLSQPETGEILWQGVAVHRNRPDFYAHLAYAGHTNGLKGDLSTRENLRFAAILRGRHTNQNELLHGLRLTACADLPTRNLSAGQKRRAALARVLGSGAQLWVLDEPFTNLDAAGIEWLGKRFNHHLSLGGLLMIAAHQASQVEPDRETILELPGGDT